jgi:BirA family transcriptional regulator, biotin operon repressor / biotin---[acetyl-CoA-carboxylase] ligase
LNGRVCLAEKQTAGRGRRGRSWVAEPYRDLMMSIGVEYPQWPAGLPTLGLVTALILVEALETLGARGLMVKWPNDVVYEHRKLCGVLLDVNGEAHGACRVIVGIGINLSTGSGQSRDIDQQWADLEAVAGRTFDRNAVASQCLELLLPAFRSFPARGFAAYQPAWRRLDALRDRQVTVHSADGGAFVGMAAGVDESGRLKVADAAGGRRFFTQGDVSVRSS